MQAFEGVGHSAATRSWHVGFEAQDFKAQPVGFAAGEDVCVQISRSTGFGAASERASSASGKQAGQAKPDQPCQAQNFAEYQGKICCILDLSIDPPQ
jgi:hypothetical protein